MPMLICLSHSFLVECNYPMGRNVRRDTSRCQGAFFWKALALHWGMAKAVDSQCRTFQLAIQVLGRSWNALILNVLQEGPLRFSELSERAKGPGDKVLSARLKDLEVRGLLVRSVEAGPPVRVSYELTRS